MTKILKSSLLIALVAFMMFALLTGCGEAEKVVSDMTSSNSNATSQTVADTTEPLNSENNNNNSDSNNGNNNNNANNGNSNESNNNSDANGSNGVMNSSDIM